MSNLTKKWLIIATSLILVGGIIFTGVMAVLKWNFSKLATVKYVTNTYEITDDFSDILINTNTADITILPSNDEKCSVVCYEEKTALHTVTVGNNILAIEVINKTKWFDYIGLNFDTPKITIYLPKTEYTSLSISESTGDIKISKDFTFKNADIKVSTGDIEILSNVTETAKLKCSTGDIVVRNISSELLQLTVDVTTGKVNLTDIACKSIVSNGSTGDMALKNVVAKEKISIERSTGDISFDGVDAAEIFTKTDTGDVCGSLLSEKVFVAETDTGDIDVPNTQSGGRCEITTNTGDIKITLK